MRILKGFSSRLDAELARIALDAAGVLSVVVGTGVEFEGGVNGVQMLVPDEWVAVATSALERLAGAGNEPLITLEYRDVRAGGLLPKKLEDEDAVHKVVSDYYEAFVKDPVTAARYYGEPALVVLPDKVISLARHADIEAFFGEGQGHSDCPGIFEH
jgi:hypothetical protein